MATLPIALIQTRTPASPAAALAHVAPLIREAAAGGAKLILTPEATNFLIKDPAARAAALTTGDQDAVIAGLRDLARELGVWLLIGSAIVKSGHAGDDRAANRSLLIDDTGAVVATYDKLHVYDVDLPTGERWRESAAIRPGNKAVVADTPWARLGLTICYDIRFPHLYRALAKADAGMIAVPAAFTVPTGDATGRPCCAPGPSRRAAGSSPPPRPVRTRTAAAPGVDLRWWAHGARWSPNWIMTNPVSCSRPWTSTRSRVPAPPCRN